MGVAVSGFRTGGEALGAPSLGSTAGATPCDFALEEEGDALLNSGPAISAWSSEVVGSLSTPKAGATAADLSEFAGFYPC